MSEEADKPSFTVARFDEEHQVWRCGLCDWEIETDDNVRGYCSHGHQFDCSNTPGFEALDADSSEDDSISSSESWDEYETDDLIEDGVLKDPHKRLHWLIHVIDEGVVEDTLLLETLDEIADFENEYVVLIHALNSLDKVEHHDEEDVQSENDQSHGEEGDTAVVEDEDEYASDQTLLSDSPGELSDTLYSDDEDPTNSWQPEISDTEESTEDEGEEEESDERDDDGVDQASALRVLAQERPPTQQDITKLRGTIQFLLKLNVALTNPQVAETIEYLTHLCDTLDLRTRHARPSQQLPGRPVPQPASIHDLAKLDLDDGAKDPVTNEPLFFDPSPIKAALTKKYKLVQEHDHGPPYSLQQEHHYEWDIEDVDEELVVAIQEARAARNDAKKKYDDENGWREMEVSY